jgi:hypothetical protein
MAGEKAPAARPWEKRPQWQTRFGGLQVETIRGKILHFTGIFCI